MDKKLKTLKDIATEGKMINYFEEIRSFDVGRITRVVKGNLKQEAIKWVKLLLKLTKTKIIKMPEIKLTKKRIIVQHGHFDGQCLTANHQPTPEFFSALILCKMYDLTEEDLK